MTARQIAAASPSIQNRAMHPAPPIRSGVALSLGAALSFGASVPLLSWASREASALACGCLVYLGAGLAAAVVSSSGGSPIRLAAMRRKELLALLGMALTGGLLAPALLVSGLQQTDPAMGSLILALEAPFTCILARIVYREYSSPRVVAAITLIFLGSAAASAGVTDLHRPSLGALLVAAATLAWAIDNTLSRSLVAQAPLAIVAAKGLLGASGAGIAAAFMGQVWPTGLRSMTLLVCGAAGYGLSLALYLRAQHLIGSARTASVFSGAPFIGTALALAFGSPWPGASFVLSAALVALGVWLHATEVHEHDHEHAALEHDHLHTHDDGHHDHRHDPMPSGAHSHPHRHAAQRHSHPHSEDLHHLHPH